MSEQRPSKERDAFEAWCKESGLITDWTKGVFDDELLYQKPLVQLCWQCWQAARATVEPKTELTIDDGLRAHECPTCEGVGGGATRDGIEVDCSTCNGEGTVIRPAEPPVVGWQPIETAPRDGTGFIGRSGNWLTMACWNKHRHCWCSVCNSYCHLPVDEELTHWMPCPSVSTKGEAL